MRRKFRYLLGCCTLLIAVSLLYSRQTQSERWSEADWNWLKENFRAALDHVLPIEKNPNVIVSYRSYETLQVGEPEYSLSILDRPGDSGLPLAAHVRMPDGSPIGQQLLVFHRDHPKSSITKAQKALKLKDWALTEQQCPSLTIAVQKLEQVRFGLPSDKIYMDPTVHEFHLRSNSGTIHAVLVDYENPLVKWGLETRWVIQQCSAGNLPLAESVGAAKE